MNKPEKPNIIIPESFAENGVKTDFDSNKLLNGFDRIQPDVLAGDNLNKFIDDTYKGLNYALSFGDYIENKANTDLSNLSATGESKFNAIVPTGTVISSAGSSTPTGYLYCNGAAVSRTTYAKLFSVIGTTYGTGNGTTTFNLPNYSGHKFVTSGTVSVKGNGKSLGLTGGNSTNMAIFNGGDGIIISDTTGYGVNLGTTGSTKSSAAGSLGVTTDASKSGITGTVSTATLKWYIKY